MKKKLFSLAIAAMTLASFNSMAQTPDSSCSRSNGNSTCPDSEQQCHRSAPNPYEGLTLTDAQKSQLEQLDNKRKAERKDKAESRKADRKKNAEACKAERRACKKAYLEEVKAIVGPEQYVIFLENQVINAPRRHGNPSAMHQRLSPDARKHHGREASKPQQRKANNPQ